MRKGLREWDGTLPEADEEEEIDEVAPYLLGWGGSSRSYASAASLPPSKPQPTSSRRSREERKEEEYWTCRKALRPIPEGDEQREVVKFMVEKLKLDSSVV